MTNDQLTYHQNTSTSEEIKVHLELCDCYFIPKLSTTVDIKDYAEKLFQKANRFECWKNKQLIGLVAFYHNQTENFYYITNVSVDPNHYGLGIAKKLLTSITELSEKNNIPRIILEVNKENGAALKLYTNLGFEESTNQNTTGDTIILAKKIN